MHDDVLWTLREVSDFTRIPEGTLYQYRTRHIGPPSFRMGPRVLYWRSHVLEWVAEHEAADHRYTDPALPVAEQHAINTAKARNATKDTKNATKGAPVTKRPPQSSASWKESHDGRHSARSSPG